MTMTFEQMQNVDVRKGADTIEVQIELVESHIRSHPQLALVDIYTDNGESGKDFEAPHGSD